MFWKIEEGDVVYVVAAGTLDEAERKFENAFGFIPKNLVKWTLIDEIPEGEISI